MHRTELGLFTNGWWWWPAEVERFCCGKPWNFVNWFAEFRKICHGKLWALFICW